MQIDADDIMLAPQTLTKVAPDQACGARNSNFSHSAAVRPDPYEFPTQKKESRMTGSLSTWQRCL
ncbi:MAG: hypothetical protein NVS3B28_21570 [Candidatus Velthaea sp.]